MIDNRYRRQRLLKVLPEVFAQQADDSVLSTIINSMATTLAEVDSALIRIQRDHWLAFANAQASSSDALSALERLGELLGIARLKGEEAEEAENYRQRLMLTAQIMTRGLTTPRSILELAIVTLGAEPCPKQQVIKDATLAFGLQLGTCKKCPNCDDAKASCPNAEQRVLELRLIENSPQQHQFKTEQSLKRDEHFKIFSDSLTEDVPQVRLQALKQPICYPILQNITTGEVMLFAGKIGVDEVLSVWPEVSVEEDAQFDSFSDVNTHSWQSQYRGGSAVLVDKQGTARSVSQYIYYLNGEMFPPADVPEDALNVPRFADNQAREGTRFADALNTGDSFDGNAVFADATSSKGAVFGGSSQRVRTPRIVAGKNQWLYNIYDKQDIHAIVGDFFNGSLLDNAPDKKQDVPALVTLSWWIRPPATFHLRIGYNAWVMQAERRGATQLFSRWLQQAKAAGVKATLDYSYPPLRESQKFQVALNIELQQTLQESHELLDTTPVWQLIKQEQQPLIEGALTWNVKPEPLNENQQSQALLNIELQQTLQESHELLDITPVWQLTKHLQEQQPLEVTLTQGGSKFDQGCFDTSDFEVILTPDSSRFDRTSFDASHYN